jgi:hypothetical protein
MGQGAEDAGGYEIDYDPHLDAFERGEWMQRNVVLN